MKKASLSLVFALTAFSMGAQASQISGLWCQKYDDFIAVLKIESSGDFITYSQGLQAQEIVRGQTGYISQGASHVQMVANGKDQGVVDVRTRTGLLGLKKLDLIKANGSVETYAECKAK